MVQTITIRSDGSYDINTGSNSVDQSFDSFSVNLSSKITGIVNSMLSDGIFEIHSEKDTWRQFEHVRSASGVDASDFGTVISSVDFDWIMSEVDTVIAEAVIAEAAIAEAETAPQEENPDPEIV